MVTHYRRSWPSSVPADHVSFDLGCRILLLRLLRGRSRAGAPQQQPPPDADAAASAEAQRRSGGALLARPGLKESGVATVVARRRRRGGEGGARSGRIGAGRRGRRRAVELRGVGRGHLYCKALGAGEQARREELDQLHGGRRMLGTTDFWVLV